MLPQILVDLLPVEYRRQYTTIITVAKQKVAVVDQTIDMQEAEELHTRSTK